MAQGLTLVEVARRAGLDRGHLSRIERGQQAPSLSALYRIARALGLTDLTRRLDPYVTGLAHLTPALKNRRPR